MMITTATSAAIIIAILAVYITQASLCLFQNIILTQGFSPWASILKQNRSHAGFSCCQYVVYPHVSG